MNKLSYRDEEILSEEDYKFKNLIDDKISYLSINDAWNEFIQNMNTEIDSVIEDYVQSEFKKTETYKKLQMIDEQWGNLEKTNQMTPEKEIAMGNQLSTLDEEAEQIKIGLQKKLDKIKQIIISQIINNKIS